MDFKDLFTIALGAVLVNNFIVVIAGFVTIVDL